MIPFEKSLVKTTGSTKTDPVNGKITSCFGYRKHPISGIVKFHNGVDIACPVGTPILAPASGKILNMWTDSNGGLSLSILAEDGVRFGFAHLSEYRVIPYQSVIKGEIIAFTGNTGKTTGPHLHFTVQKDGLFIDPLEFFDFH